MTAGSIRLRLFLAGGLALVVALVLAAIGMALIFDRHVQRVTLSELDARAMAVLGLVELGEDGTVRSRAATLDPRFDLPFSGHYWQLDIGGKMLRSRSLWDWTLEVPETAPMTGEQRVFNLPGPQDQTLLVLDRAFLSGGTHVRVVVATDRAELDRARHDFLDDLVPLLSLLGGLLLLASWLQVWVGLRPLGQIHKRVAALAEGQRTHMGTDLPAEVVPLAAQIDSLLDARNEELTRARHRAADLAHGFKTPLQALLGDAGKLHARGEAEVADSIETVVASMQDLVDRELTRARIRLDHRHSASQPADVIARLIRVLERMPRKQSLTWNLQSAPDLWARIDQQDLTEALGALLENAARFARNRVDIEVQKAGEFIHILICDDGPGVPAEQINLLGTRGVSLDKSAQGEGIGLSLATEIIGAAQGELTFSNATPGLQVKITLLRSRRLKQSDQA